MTDTLKLAEKQNLRYWYVDGLTELTTGALLACLALLNAIRWLLGPGSLSNWLQVLGQPLLIVGGALLSRVVVSRLKENLTYPRTGYIAYRSGPRRMRLLYTLLAAVVAVAAALFLASLRIAWLTQLLPSLLVALLTAQVGYSYGLKRFYLLAVYTALAGAPLTALKLGDTPMLVAFLGALSLGWLASGAWTLRSYLAHTQPAGEEPG